MKPHKLLLLVAALFTFTACGNSGLFIAGHSTEVQLSEPNYSIVATNVSGEASSEYILGASVSVGMTTNSFGLVSIGDTETLYKTAREELWNQFEAEHGEVEGRKLALVNIQYDANTVNFLLYTKALVTITADVVEFE